MCTTWLSAVAGGVMTQLSGFSGTHMAHTIYGTLGLEQRLLECICCTLHQKPPAGECEVHARAFDGYQRGR